MFKKIIDSIKAYNEKQRMYKEFQEACRVDPRFVQEFAAIQARQDINKYY